MLSTLAVNTFTIEDGRRNSRIYRYATKVTSTETNAKTRERGTNDEKSITQLPRLGWGYNRCKTNWKYI